MNVQNKTTVDVRIREEVRSRAPRWAETQAARLLQSRLRDLDHGRLYIREGSRTESFGPGGEPSVRLDVHSPAFYTAVALGGSLGAAESYIRGEWGADNLTALFRLMIRNAGVMDGLEQGWARIGRAIARRLHALRKNTKEGSRKNIQAHYDLGNDLFRLFLDETMTYSCGIFETPQASLSEASVAKMDRLCRKLDLSPGDHLLEIGTGWGAFAIHAASNYGCRVTTTTISNEQYALARERISEAGLDSRVTLLLEDYRNLRGRFDKLVSVEMIEAVGAEFLDQYFGACAQLIRPEGMMALQGIFMADNRYAQYARQVDFIQRFVFPGSHLPSMGAVTAALARATDFTVMHVEDITPHYARTLREWRERFFARIDEVRALGYPEEFIRLWDYYLCYCEAGFEERNILDYQILLGRPQCRRRPVLGALELE